MTTTDDLAGRIEINGRLEAERVSASFFDDYEASFSGAGEKLFRKARLHLHPFNRKMLREHDSAAMKRGFSYAIEGDCVGAYVDGPLGHPGDGEFDRRPVKAFTVQSRYDAAGLTVSIEGMTEPGISGFHGQSSLFDKPLDPWRFRIVFSVPRQELKSFFGFTDFNYPFFEKALDGCV